LCGHHQNIKYISSKIERLIFFLLTGFLLKNPTYKSTYSCFEDQTNQLLRICPASICLPFLSLADSSFLLHLDFLAMQSCNKTNFTFLYKKKKKKLQWVNITRPWVLFMRSTKSFPSPFLTFNPRISKPYQNHNFYLKFFIIIILVIPRMAIWWMQTPSDPLSLRNKSERKVPLQDARLKYENCFSFLFTLCIL